MTDKNRPEEEKNTSVKSSNTDSSVSFENDDYFIKELNKEKKFVDSAYSLLDFLKNMYRNQQKIIHKKGAKGTHQERTERDAFSSYYGDEASRLEQIHDKLVFGKLYMKDGKIHYIGRVGLRSHTTNKQILIDWRSKAAMPFYQATTIDPKNTVLRRHINTKGKEVIDFEDELLDDYPSNNSENEKLSSLSKKTTINADNSVLIGKNSLINALSTARTDKMVDIVSTIQQEQDEIIRSDWSQILLVQGGPGTGKTAVALHRGAFVLYEERKRLKNNGVLVIGPSKTFLQYVDKVLPSLGETGVLSSTIDNLRFDVKPSFKDNLEIARIKGDIYWKQICQNAVEHLRKIPETTQKIRVDNINLSITPNDIRKSMDKALHDYTSHNEARITFVKSIIDKLTHRYEKKFWDKTSTPGENEWIKESIRTHPQIQRAINLCWLPCDAQTLLHWLYKHPDFLEKCAPNFTQETRSLLINTEKKFSDNDIAIIDHLDKLLGPLSSQVNSTSNDYLLSKVQNAISSQELGNGIVNASMLIKNMEQNTNDSLELSEKMALDNNWTFGHVIVDEAQELSPMQWQMLLTRCPSHSFTIVGDLDQSRHNTKISSWVELLEPIFKTKILEKLLTISYRTPKKIMDKAIEIMSFLGQKVKYPVSCVRDIDDCYKFSYIDFNDEKAFIKELSEIIIDLSAQMDKEYGNHIGKLAVILNSEDYVKVKKLISDFLINNMAIFPKKRIVIIEASHTKGLEYDYVVLVNPDKIAKESYGDLYVGLTRATKKLYVLSDKDSNLPL